MGENRIFDPTIDLASRSLDMRSRRHELLISNIANADTPGYKAFDMLVEEALARQDQQEGRLVLQKTHSTHLPSRSSLGDGLNPQVVRQTEPSALRGDGNTVDMERQMSALAANELLYKASAQVLSKKFQSLRNVIQGGKR